MSLYEITLSRTKIVVPALRPEVLHRARLLALFDDLLDRKLILVTAPAGYGKTTLLIDFAHQSGMPVCWFSLDALDRDPQRFIAYLIAALAQRFPKFGKRSNAILRSLTSLEQDAERLISTIVNEITDQIDEHFALVVDDYHFVDGVAPIRDLFSRFVYLAGENCHVVLASRRLPALPEIALMVARQQVGGFDLGQLAFRPEEVRSLFEKNYGQTLDAESLEELMRQTEGWITGLHLSAGGLPVDAPDPSSIALRANLMHTAHAAGVDLGMYFDQQVLAPQPPEVRAFLLKTSLLDEFDASLCEAFLGPGNWKKLLEAVRRNNLFVLPVGPEGKWLRYHHLFQSFLQERIRQEEPETVQALLGRLAEVYEERRGWEQAYAACRQLCNPDLLADLLERAGTPMLLSERLVTLQAWLEDLPPSLVQERPSLLSLKGALLCTLGEGGAALAGLDRAVSDFRQNGDPAGLALALVRRAAAYRLLGDYVNSLQDAEEALQLSADRSGLKAVYAEAERFKGINLYHLGQIKDAARFLEDAFRRYRQLNEDQSAARALMELGMTHRARGDYPAAREAYEQALATWRATSNMYAQADVLNSLGVLHHYQGEYDQAVRAFETGLESIKHGHSPWHEALLLTSLGDMYVDIDEFDSAVQAYTNAVESLQQVSFQFLTNYLSLVRARLARLQGLLEAARFHLEEAGLLVQAGGSNFECGLFYLERGCLYLREDNPQAAIPDLEAALDHFQRGHLAAETAWSRVWLAAARVQCGNVALARTDLGIALQTDRAGAMLSPLLQVVRRARPWLAALKDDPEIGSTLKPWLERAGQAEARLPLLRKRLRLLLTTVPIQAPRLAIQAFGKAQVRVNGKLVTSAQWKTASVRELFFYFLLVSRPVSKEEVGEVLWPEIEPRQLKLRFKNDLYRLRRALGQEAILFEDDCYHFNRLLDYEYDVETFEAHLAKAKAAAGAEEKIAHLLAAASLHRGPYLQEIHATWAWPGRERLEREALEALKELAGLQRRAGDLAAALQACQEALEIDPCREDVHSLAMQIHAERGDRLAVVWQYQACREALRLDLGLEPSDEVETLYRRLTA